jgi:cytochrome d ubiquinol oxidase subunit I
LIFSVVVATQGHHHAQEVTRIQPAKLAAMEALWETPKEGEGAPMYLLVLPDEENEQNAIEALGIPGGLSFLAHGSFTAPVQGLKEWPKEDRPPVLITFLSFRAMVGLGTLMIALAAWAWLSRNRLEQSPTLLRLLPYAIPIPYLAIEAGWIVAEVGRQPWIVYGLMRTAEAVSPVATSQVAFSLVALTVLYALLGAADIAMLTIYARKGPKPA